jgi:predicted site-specific integrase-resolvase
MTIKDIDSLPQVGTRADYAWHLGVSTKTLQRAERRGEIRSLRPNSKTVLYRRIDILRMLRERGVI